MSIAADHLVVRIAEIDVDPNQLAAYLVELRREIAVSLAAEPGVLQLQAVQTVERPSQIRLLEVYRNTQAYEAHIQSPHFLAYKLATAEMVVALRLIDCIPVALKLE